MVGSRWLAAALVSVAAIACRGKEAAPVINNAAVIKHADSLVLKGELDSAIAQYSQVLAMDSTNIRVFNSRGGAYRDKSEYARAIQDFDRALAINPHYEQALRNRGRTHFYLGHYYEAAADFNNVLAFDSTNANLMLWLHVAKRRMRQDDWKQFSADMAKIDSTKWPAPVAKYFLRKLTANQLRDSSTLVDDRVGHDHRCSAAFFLGQDAMINRKRADALALFEEASAICPKPDPEYRAVAGELTRLKGAASPAR